MNPTHPIHHQHFDRATGNVIGQPRASAARPERTALPPELREPHRYTALQFLRAYREHCTKNRIPMHVAAAARRHEEECRCARAAGIRVKARILADHARLMTPLDRLKILIEGHTAKNNRYLRGMIARGHAR